MVTDAGKHTNTLYRQLLYKMMKKKKKVPLLWLLLLCTPNWTVCGRIDSIDQSALDGFFAVYFTGSSSFKCPTSNC